MSSSEIKIKIYVKLDPPLPSRQFITVCKQRTVKELRNELKRRILTITTEPLILTLDGYELMDDDEVEDILWPMSEIHLKVADNNTPAPSSQAECLEPPCFESSKRPYAVISRKEHGDGKAKGKRTKSYLAEEIYENTQPQEQSSDSDSPDEQP
ncbi:hypothetical protein IWW36_000741 [Coemansia brasiliensis]|uniref:Ubiquitin-like domain-containing protein n=1 Tax=Coemansia brasiliensis TaxID=2650707 RepID=A0A9W8II84_9FUNG|nr:hypothetical protein IWW36_000741 [Coemansia brasiliensis]